MLLFAADEDVYAAAAAAAVAVFLREGGRRGGTTAAEPPPPSMAVRVGNGDAGTDSVAPAAAAAAASAVDAVAAAAETATATVAGAGDGTAPPPPHASRPGRVPSLARPPLWRCLSASRRPWPPSWPLATTLTSPTWTLGGWATRWRRWGRPPPPRAVRRWPSRPTRGRGSRPTGWSTRGSTMLSAAPRCRPVAGTATATAMAAAGTAALTLTSTAAAAAAAARRLRRQGGRRGGAPRPVSTGVCGWPSLALPPFPTASTTTCGRRRQRRKGGGGGAAARPRGEQGRLLGGKARCLPAGPAANARPALRPRGGGVRQRRADRGAGDRR
ncbi:hypothetical protein I4F81_006905 [Pyropia yezoensis]|uniref:Uncharacterized protein n=1 Tax=Pyropia yezoensis TaxID=2788 RepID=A0ACC3C3I4_PYRYE|nr:hypothetical protein I4F81_006905 [Neopyropia yezoensis]